MATAGLFLQRCRYQWPRAVIVMATHATLTQHWLETWNCCRSRPLTKIYPHPPPTHPSGTSSGRRRPLRVPLPSSAPERSSCKSNRNDSLGSIAVNISSFDYFSSFFQSFTEHGRQTSTDNNWLAPIRIQSTLTSIESSWAALQKIFWVQLDWNNRWPVKHFRNRPKYQKDGVTWLGCL